MGYFEFHHESADDSRVHVFCRTLKLAIPHGLGHLAMLKSWASSEKHRAYTGDLSGFIPETLAEAAKYQGEPLDFIGALIHSGLVVREKDTEGIEHGKEVGGFAALDNWLEECGETCRRRIERRTTSDSVGQEQDGIDCLLKECDPTTQGKRPCSPVWSLFLVLKYIKKGKSKEGLYTDARWDALNKGANLPWLKKILDAFEGETKRAALALLEISDWLEKIGCSWNAATIYKKITDWEEGRLKS